MATIEKRTTLDGKISYRVKIRMKGEKPVTATFDKLTDAKTWEKQTETEIKQGRYFQKAEGRKHTCLLYTSPSPRDGLLSRMPSSA